MKRSVPLLWLALSLVLPAAARAGLTVSPVLIEKTVSPQDDLLEIVLANSSDEPMRVTLSAVPLVHDPDGRPREATEPYPWDISGLLRFETPEVVLRPRKWKRIRVRVAMPGRPGGGYAMIFARGQPVNAPAGTISAALRIGVVVELTFPGQARQAVALEELSFDSAGAKIRVSNQGDTHVRPSGSLVIRDARGAPVWSAELGQANVFPGMSREIPVPSVPTWLAAGQYLAEVTLAAPAPTAMTRRVAVIDGRPTVERAAAVRTR